MTDGSPSTLGGDGSFDLDSFLVFQNSDGTTRKISLRHFLGFLGFNVGTESEIETVITSRSSPMMGFITDGRKVNHVEGSGTFAEGAGNGTGILGLWETSANPEGVDDGSAVST